MDRLSIPHPERGCVDLCFATSMIEVGIDIDRLGLLTMFGQPKSASQYIQVAGRIGRDEHHAPGVVFVLLSPYNSRDRSHFEQFTSFHRRLYASVEPVSITRFTPAALERGLAGALSAWVRQATGSANPQEALAALKEAIGPIAAAPGRARRRRTSAAASTNSKGSSPPPPTPAGVSCAPTGPPTVSSVPSATTPHPRPTAPTP